MTVGEVRDNNDGSYVASFVGEQVGEAKLHVSINDQEVRESPYSFNISVGRNYQALNLPNKIVIIMVAWVSPMVLYLVRTDFGQL